MATIGSLVVDLRTNTAKFDQGLNRSNRKLDGFRNTVSKASRALGIFGVALGGAALTRFASNAITATAALEDAARTAGIGVGRFQELTKAFSDLGGIAEKTTGEAFRRFNRRLGLAQQGSGEAAKTFEQLGITLTEGTGKALEETITKLAGIQDAAARSAAASQVFGEDAGPRLAAVLGMGSKAIDDQVRRLREQGRVLGEDNVKAAGALDDTLGELSDTMSTQLTRAVTDNADEFNRLAKTLQSDAFTSAMDATVGFFAAMGTEAARSAKQIGNLVNLLKGEFDGKAILDNSIIGVARRAFGMGSDEEPETPESRQKPVVSEPSVVSGGADRSIDKAGESLDDFTNKLALHNRELRAELEGWSAFEEQMQAVEAASKDLGRQLTEGETEAVRGLIEQRQELTRAIEENNEKLKEQDSVARDVGLTFESAFENAIVEGEKLSDVIKGLAKDLLRLFVRKKVTEPLMDAFLGSFNFGGARAAGGPVNSGSTYLVGEKGPELFTPSRNGTIIPNGGSSGGFTINQNISIAANGDSALRQVAAEAARRGAQEGYALVQQDMARNGPIRRSIA